MPQSTSRAGCRTRAERRIIGSKYEHETDGGGQFAWRTAKGQIFLPLRKIPGEKLFG